MVHGGDTLLQSFGKRAENPAHRTAAHRSKRWRVRHPEKVRELDEASKRRRLAPKFSALFSRPDRFIRVAEDAYGRQMEFVYVDREGNKLPVPFRPNNLYHIFLALFRRGMIQEVRSTTVEGYEYLGSHRARPIDPSVDLVYYGPVMEEN